MFRATAEINVLHLNNAHVKKIKIFVSKVVRVHAMIS